MKLALSNVVCHYGQVTAAGPSGLCPLEHPGQDVQVLTGRSGGVACPLDCGNPADLDKLHPCREYSSPGFIDGAVRTKAKRKTGWFAGPAVARLLFF